MTNLMFDNLKPIPATFLDKRAWFAENAEAFAVLDGFPVSPGHTLVLPKRSVFSLFQLDSGSYADVWSLVKYVRYLLDEEFSPAGYNIGINEGTAAGQTIGHAHVHIIPRYAGDRPNPRGGVRAVIPGKADY